uniref:TauD/TfdA-like domain-containing protein n=1 Tax=Ciona savignyi TaxID=51511 RepID=H2ZG48_CIOSA
YLEIQKTHIVVDYFGKISAINWHPGYASASTLRIKEQDVERFYKARKKFANIINRPDLTTKYNFRLESGDLIIFNNRRVAHAREEFHLNGGNRHLQGCYLCLDDAKGKYMTLAKKLGLEVTPP